MKALAAIVIMVLFAPLPLAGQVEVQPYLDRLSSGELEEVREEVSDLVDQYPNDAGVRYLQGLVTEDGTDAVRVFQGLVDRYPESEWADDALYKVYQFYYSIGLYRTAELKMGQLRGDYPDSPFLTSAGAKVTPKADPPAESETTDPVPVVSEGGATGSGEAVSQPGGGQFALQVGAYSSRENADKQKFFFEDQGFPVEVINRVRDGRALFLVLVGNYLTYEDAKAKSADIRRSYGVDSFVVSR
ncbi:MAG: SPOR domain-containing protein [Ignavibacteria bacterium]|nr:SPOR domain-containing protein [Ignavibacteria bacterium]